VLICEKAHPSPVEPARGGKSEIVLLPLPVLSRLLVAELSRLLQASKVLRETLLADRRLLIVDEAAVGKANRIQERIRSDTTVAGVLKGGANQPNCRRRVSTAKVLLALRQAALSIGE